MNAGPNHKVALAQALANAQRFNKCYYVWLYQDTYWVEDKPPNATWAGAYPENVKVVHPEGRYESWSEFLARQKRKETPRVDAHR